MTKKQQPNQVFKPDIYVGIDPGVNTGVAVWHTKEQFLETAKTFNIVEAMHWISLQYASGIFHGPPPDNIQKSVHIVIEDARKRKGDAGLTDEKKQGAGSVKRDSKIWQEFCEYYGIPYTLKAPNVKLNAIAKNREVWERQTGYTKQTSEHARCAAMLVWKL